MATFIHSDLSANNPSRAKEFYEKLFDWEFKLLPQGYYLIETKELEGKPGMGRRLFLEDKNAR